MTVIDGKDLALHEEDVHAGEVSLPTFLVNERELGMLDTIKKYRRVLLICNVTFTSVAVFGYDVVVNGASISMPAFLLTFGKIGPTGPYLPSIWTSLWTAMSSLMQAISAIMCGWVIDRFGRKWPASAAASLTLVGTAVQYTASSPGSLLGGKMVSGLGIGAVMAVATTYAAEIAPLKLRAPIQAALVIATVFTQGVALGVIRSFVPNIEQQAFRNVFAIQWAVGGLAAICWALAPESPVYLAKRGNVEAAVKAMTRIYGENNDAKERVDYVIHTLEEEKQSENGGGTYVACFRGRDLKRTLTVVYLYSTANLGGAAFLSQNIYFLITAGLAPIHAFDVGIGGFGLAILIICLSGLYLQRITRRTVVLAGLLLNMIIMVVIGGLWWAPGKGPLWAIAVLMNLLISVQTATLQGAGWPIAAEIPSYRLRAKTLSIGVFAQTFTTWLVLFTTPYMYNVDSGNLGARTGFIYAGLTIFLLFGAWLIVPNTTGMTTEEIDNAYELRKAPRNFQ